MNEQINLSETEIEEIHDNLIFDHEIIISSEEDLTKKVYAINHYDYIQLRKSFRARSTDIM